MLDLEYDLKAICRRNRDGSRMTQAQREQRLRLIARELHGLGYRNLRAQSLKPKHVEALIADWQGKALSAGTIKNRMADLRWWAEKTGKQSVLASDNAHYGIDRRVFVTNDSKARELHADALALVLELQRVLAYPKRARAIPDPAGLAALIADTAIVVHPERTLQAVTDEADNRVLEANSPARPST